MGFIGGLCVGAAPGRGGHSTVAPPPVRVVINAPNAIYRIVFISQAKGTTNTTLGVA